MRNTKTVKMYKLLLCFITLAFFIELVICSPSPVKTENEKQYVGIERTPETVLEYISLCGMRFLNLANTLIESFFSYKIVSDAIVHGAIVRVMLVAKLLISLYFILNFRKNMKKEYSPVKKDLELLEAENISAGKDSKDKSTNKKSDKNFVVFEKAQLRASDFIKMNKISNMEDLNRSSSLSTVQKKKTLAIRILNMFIVLATKLIYMITLFNSSAFLLVTVAVFTNYMTESSISNFLIESLPAACSFIDASILALEFMASRYLIILMGCLAILAKSSSVYYNAICIKDKEEKAKRIRMANKDMLKNTITKIVVMVLAITFNLNALLIFIETGCRYFFSNEVLKKVERFIVGKRRKPLAIESEQNKKYNLKTELLICKISNGICVALSIFIAWYILQSNIQFNLSHPLLFNPETKISSPHVAL